MITSLETRWLRAPKWLPVPIVVVTPMTGAEDYLGRYFHPAREEALFGSRYYDRRNGIIEIREDADAHTLAHEFRHHWQYMTGMRFDHWMPILDGWEEMEEDHFRKSMAEFFLTSKTEQDALHYALSKYPDWWASEILEWMQDPAIRKRVRRFPALLELFDRWWVYTGVIYRLYEAPKPKPAVSAT